MRRLAGGTLFVVWQPRRPEEGPLVLAHRGASALETENTVAAFRRARTDGADGVELDVLLCATGEVMVFHDDDLRRLAGRPERLADLPYRALREVQLPRGTTIPTLEEALEACGPELLVNVELKANDLGFGPTAALVEAVAGVIARTASGARVLVSSFNPWAVHLWTRRAPEVRAALLFERASMLPLRRAWLAPWVRPFALHPELVLCSAGRVAAWHRRGYQVNVWTVDDPAALRDCRRMGVDGVITNDPARSRAALASA
jgi:glycerophosphoryl diester phosphodiesterase